MADRDGAGLAVAGAIALLIELLLARLVFRMHLAMLQLGDADPQTKARIRRCLLSASSTPAAAAAPRDGCGC